MHNNKTLSFRHAQLSDADWIAENLRADDRAECLALGFADPAAMMRDGILAPGAETIAVLHQEQPIGLFGIQPGVSLCGSRALVWFLGTKELSYYPKKMVTITKRYFALKLMCYTTLFNYVDSRYHKSVKWLKICGVKFSPDKDRLFNGILFHYFEIKKIEGK